MCYKYKYIYGIALTLPHTLTFTEVTLDWLTLYKHLKHCEYYSHKIGGATCIGWRLSFTATLTWGKADEITRLKPKLGWDIHW